MSTFDIDIEWDSPRGARGDELRATWARLKILVDGIPLTRVEDHEGHGVRPGIFIPLYPVAEWIARHWWSLLHEVPLPRSARGSMYDVRHNLRRAAEGFALPDLLFQPEGNQICLEWIPADRKSCGVTFLGGGRVSLDRATVEFALRKFVDTVVTRLEDQGIRGTFLSEEWQAISEADTEERAYCVAMGRLGEDPYDEHSEDSQLALITFAKTFPTETVEEFLSAVDFLDLKDTANRLSEFANTARHIELDLQPLLTLKERFHRTCRDVSSGSTPWKQGYELARMLRNVLDIPSDTGIRSGAELGGFVGAAPEPWKDSISRTLIGCDYISAAVAPTQDRFPCFSISGSFEPNRVFALCRGLFEYLIPETEITGIATGAHSERQRRNRAFAAEFIAPAAGIKDQLTSGVSVSEEDVVGIAEHFGTSEYVIRHQIRNHRIATIQDALEV